MWLHGDGHSEIWLRGDGHSGIWLRGDGQGMDTQGYGYVGMDRGWRLRDVATWGWTLRDMAMWGWTLRDMATLLYGQTIMLVNHCMILALYTVVN